MCAAQHKLSGSTPIFHLFSEFMSCGYNSSHWLVSNSHVITITVSDWLLRVLQLTLYIQLIKRLFIELAAAGKHSSVESGIHETTGPSKQPIRVHYLGHVTSYQPIRDQYFLIWSVPDTSFFGFILNLYGYLTLIIFRKVCCSVFGSHLSWTTNVLAILAPSNLTFT